MVQLFQLRPTQARLHDFGIPSISPASGGFADRRPTKRRRPSAKRSRGFEEVPVPSSWHAELDMSASVLGAFDPTSHAELPHHTSPEDVAVEPPVAGTLVGATSLLVLFRLAAAVAESAHPDHHKATLISLLLWAADVSTDRAVNCDQHVVAHHLMQQHAEPPQRS